jgi:NADH-quinone oxidoreductase subunit F
MVGILEDKDRIFTNLYGLQDWTLDGAKTRGAWNATKDMLDLGRDWIIANVKTPTSRTRACADAAAPASRPA